MLHHAPLFRCYFGNTQDALHPQEYLRLNTVPDILSLDPFAQHKQRMALRRLIFLRQTHSTDGIVISDSHSAESMAAFAQSGDYLITNQQHVGIGVMTADCLPVILIDTVHNAIGVAHAGWRGTVAGISTHMLADMHTAFGSSPEQIQAYFGPTAQRCCYQVSPSFLTQLEHLPFKDQLITERSNGAERALYFDNLLCNKLLLQSAGIKKEALCDAYAVCTMCDHSFYSHRRGDKGRQMTVVTLV